MKCNCAYFKLWNSKIFCRKLSTPFSNKSDKNIFIYQKAMVIQASTLSAAYNELRKRGFTHNFSVNKNGQPEGQKGIYFSPTEVDLVEFHRFDGMTNPSDDSILYAVKTASGFKGTVVDSYGYDGSEVTSGFMNKVAQKQFDN